MDSTSYKACHALSEISSARLLLTPSPTHNSTDASPAFVSAPGAASGRSTVPLGPGNILSPRSHTSPPPMPMRAHEAAAHLYKSQDIETIVAAALLLNLAGTWEHPSTRESQHAPAPTCPAATGAGAARKRARASLSDGGNASKRRRLASGAALDTTQAVDAPATPPVVPPVTQVLHPRVTILRTGMQLRPREA